MRDTETLLAQLGSIRGPEDVATMSAHVLFGMLRDCREMLGDMSPSARSRPGTHFYKPTLPFVYKTTCGLESYNVFTTQIRKEVTCPDCTGRATKPNKKK